MWTLRWTVSLGFGIPVDFAYLIGHSTKPRWDVDMAEGPIAFVDTNLCVPKAVRIRSVEFFAPVLGHIDGLYVQIWRLGHGKAHTLKAQSPVGGWTSRGGLFAVPLDLQAAAGDCVGWAYNRSSGGVIGFSHAAAGDGDAADVNSAYFSRLLTWPPILDSDTTFDHRVQRDYAIRLESEPPSCWEKGQSWMSCCGPARSGARIVPACWPGDLEMHRDCCGDTAAPDLHADSPLLGNPHCFAGQDEQMYSYESCCNRQHGPEGNMSCWDGLMDFQYCCRPALTVPQRDASCWQGKLQHQHELCCRGSRQAEGPRGLPSCWMQSEEEQRPDFENTSAQLNALRCCDLFESDGGSRCLLAGHATTCSLPGIAFRQLTKRDLLFARSQAAELRSQHPLLHAVPNPRRLADAHLLLLGVGPFSASARQLEQEAIKLGVFKEIHTYTDFSFVDNNGIWRRHISAWHKGARIAGFGWWKAVLCRRHLAALPQNGILVFSDAGNRLHQESAATWREVLSAMQRFDFLGVVETEFVERRFTKRLAMERFASALRGTAAADEGQFITGLVMMRRTPTTERLLQTWEQLVRNIDLVDETLHHQGEDGFFQAHRHEQSILSLLLKCAILGRSMKLGRMRNLSARVLTLRSDIEAAQLIEFARRRS